MKNDKLESVDSGDAIKADSWNEVLKTVKQFQGLNSSFTSGTVGVTRPQRLGTNLSWVLLTEPVDAAAFNPTTKKLTPAKFTPRVMYFHEDDDDTITFNDDVTDTVDALSYYTTDVSVSPGYGRFAYLADNELLIVDCNEFSLT